MATATLFSTPYHGLRYGYDTVTHAWHFFDCRYGATPLPIGVSHPTLEQVRLDLPYMAAEFEFSR